MTVKIVFLVGVVFIVGAPLFSAALILRRRRATRRAEREELEARWHLANLEGQTPFWKDRDERPEESH